MKKKLSFVWAWMLWPLFLGWMAGFTVKGVLMTYPGNLVAHVAAFAGAGVIVLGAFYFAARKVF